ncbi:MAG: phosphoglycerate dehydrogenase [Clostridiales Family XIII bacterium]|jgi:D-3-phosphoglycerate dehydrogenase|nr:phosphoglycerate dehydrogenase [Clostridiales Family XIII bacterium]
MNRILITPRSFGKHSDEAFRLIEEKGYSIVLNDTGGIMGEEALKEAIAGCDGAIIGVDPLNAEVMRRAPGLRAVAKYGVGTDNIDTGYCENHGIRVSKTIGANSEAVADYAFALILALARKVLLIDSECRRGNWKKITATDVSGRTLGLIGLGAVGKNMVRRAKGFSMHILAYNRNWNEGFAEAEGVERAEIDDIVKRSDFLSLHLPLNPGTEKIIDARRIEMMKPNAFLINTARGGLVDDEALLSALKNGSIGGAGLDVFGKEPPDDVSWYALDNVVIGSHCAASTEGAADRMSIRSAENLIRDLENE